MKGKVKLDNLIMRCEDLSEVTPARAQYKDWASEDGNFQIKTIPSFKQVTFQTSVLLDRENLLKEIDGKTVVATSSLFDTFECVVTAQKYGVNAGSSRAIYNITLRSDNSRVGK